MTKTIPILLLLTVLTGSVEAGQRVTAIQSVSVVPYEAAVKGFEGAYGSRTERLLISKLKAENVARAIHDSRPDLILAVGRDALLIAKGIETIPVVYCMVLDPRSILSDEKHIRGVSMNLTPEKQLNELSKVLPAVKDIGLLFDPDKTGSFVRDAQRAAVQVGINLSAEPVLHSRDVSVRINQMKKVGLFWMLPDTTVVSPATVESLLVFSLEKNVPILTFSEKYVELGAVLSIGIDAFDIGTQAGEIARKISAGTDIDDLHHVDARKAHVVLNAGVARKLGIGIERDAMRNIKVIK